MLTGNHLRNVPSTPGLNSSASTFGSNGNQSNDGITPISSGGDRRLVLEGQQLSPPNALRNRTSTGLQVKDGVFPMHPSSTKKESSSRKKRRRKRLMLKRKNDAHALGDDNSSSAQFAQSDTSPRTSDLAQDSQVGDDGIEESSALYGSLANHASIIEEASGVDKGETSLSAEYDQQEEGPFFAKFAGRYSSVQIKRRLKDSPSIQQDVKPIASKSGEETSQQQMSIPLHVVAAKSSSSSSLEVVSTSPPDEKLLSSGSSSDLTQKFSRESSNRSINGLSSSARSLYENSPASSTRSTLLGQNFLPEFEELSLAYSSQGSSAGSGRPISRGSNHSDRSNASRSLFDLVVGPKEPGDTTSAPAYDGPLVALVEAMHGSGSSMDFNESLNSFTTNPSELSKQHQTSSSANMSMSISTRLSQSRDNYKSSSEFYTSSEIHSSAEMYMSSSSSNSFKRESKNDTETGKGKKQQSTQKRRRSAPKTKFISDKARSPSTHKGQRHRRSSLGSFDSTSFDSRSVNSADDKKASRLSTSLSPKSRMRSSRRHSWDPSTKPRSKNPSLAGHLKSEPGVSTPNSIATSSSTVSAEGAKSVIRKLDGIGESHSSLNAPLSSSPVARRKLRSDSERRRTNSLPARIDRIRSHRRREYIISKLPKDQSPVTQSGERITISRLMDHLSAESLDDLEVDVPSTPPSPRRKKNRLTVSAKHSKRLDTVDARARTLRISNRSCDMLPPRVQTRSSLQPNRPSSPWDKARSAIGHPPKSASSVSSGSTSCSSSSRWSFSSFSISSGSSHQPHRRHGDKTSPKVRSLGTVTLSVQPPPVFVSAKQERRHSIGIDSAESIRPDSPRSMYTGDEHSNSMSPFKRRRSLDAVSSQNGSLSSFHESFDDSFSEDSWSPGALSQSDVGVTATIESAATKNNPQSEKSPKIGRNRSGSSSSCSLDLAPFKMEIPKSPRESRSRRHRNQLPVTSSGSVSISESTDCSDDSFARHRRSLGDDDKSVPSLAASSSSSAPIQLIPTAPSPPLPSTIGGSHGSFDSPIWSKLKSEKERQGKIRARLNSMGGTPANPSDVGSGLGLAKTPKL